MAQTPKTEPFRLRTQSQPTQQQQTERQQPRDDVSSSLVSASATAAPASAAIPWSIRCVSSACNECAQVWDDADRDTQETGVQIITTLPKHSVIPVTCTKDIARGLSAGWQKTKRIEAPELPTPGESEIDPARCDGKNAVAALNKNATQSCQSERTSILIRRPNAATTYYTKESSWC